ncbi:hypothetical protein Mapa_000287 [Marchantia paleacea]|nr:hypothetical protein Mapa_000287 [Marchantia paleacea]
MIFFSLSSFPLLFFRDTVRVVVALPSILIHFHYPPRPELRVLHLASREPWMVCADDVVGGSETSRGLNENFVPRLEIEVREEFLSRPVTEFVQRLDFGASIRALLVGKGRGGSRRGGSSFGGMMDVGMELNSPSRSEAERGELDLDKLNIFSDKWNIVEHVRSLWIVLMYMLAWFARLLLHFLPQGVELYGLTTALESIGHNLSATPAHEEQDHVGTMSNGAIGRSLLQVLALVNDLPASSRKYAFARALAEKIIHENSTHGHGYESVNRSALGAGFKRSLTLLNESLVGLHHQQKRGAVWSLPMKVMSLIPTAGMTVLLPPPLSLIRSRIGHLLNRAVQSGQGFASPSMESSENAEFAEKLGQELLWLAEKMGECSALEEGIVQWSSSGSLASLALSASPRVQRSLVRLSALLSREVVSGRMEVAREVRFKLLLLWIPLFCTATHGVDGVIFNTAEKAEVERTLEMAIRTLPESDQEVILAIWLQEYALSSSDWPNLQNCYDGWCHATRKLSHQAHVESGCSQKQISHTSID